MPRKKAQKKDDLSQLPPAVQKQAKAAADAQAKASGKDPEPVKEPASDSTPAEPATNEPAPQGVEPGHAQPAQPTDGADWEQKYNVLQGKYDSEITALHTALKSQEAVIANLNGMVESLQNQPAQKEPEPEPVQVDLLNVENYEAYGDEVPDLVKKVNFLLKENADLKTRLTQAPADDRVQKLESTVDQIGQKVHMSARDVYFSQLNQHVPDWQEINHMPEFAQWLNEVDPLTGYVRGEIVKAANQNLDSARVIAIFNLFKQEKGIAPAQPAQNPEPDNSLESQVVPDNAGPANPDNPLPPQGEEITAEDLKNAQKQYIDGLIPESEYNKVAEKFQQMIARKQKEGQPMGQAPTFVQNQ